MRRILWLAAALPLAAAAQGQQDLVGSQMAAEMERHVNVISDPAITGYVDRIAQKVATFAGLTVPLKVKVISGGDAYAIILPGGFCDVDSKLILTAANEAELAGALAHYVAHIALWKEPPPASIGTIPLVFLGGGGGICMRGSSHMAIPMGTIATGREIESKADLLGLDYMEKAGYDPGALPDLFERILKRRPGSVSQVFDTGTMPAATRTQAEAMRTGRSFVVSTSEFRDIQRRLAELAPKPAPATAPSLRAGH